MQKGSTLFQLRADGKMLFDGSNVGVPIQRSVNAKTRPGGRSVSLANGVIEIGRHQVLDDLSAFTIEATVTPKAIGPQRQNIIEGQSPGIALFISPEGKLVGSMSINGAWTGLDSGAVTIAANTPTAVRFTRDEAGKTELMRRRSGGGVEVHPGAIQKAGEAGFKVGAWGGRRQRGFRWNGRRSVDSQRRGGGRFPRRSASRRPGSSSPPSRPC